MTAIVWLKNAVPSRFLLYLSLNNQKVSLQRKKQMKHTADSERYLTLAVSVGATAASHGLFAVNVV